MAGYVVISVDGARTLLADQAVTILDLRDHRSYRAGHIDGAMLLHDGLMKRLIKENELDKPILIYCYRGNTSLEKAELFSELGFRHVYSLEGGYVDWQKRAAGGSADSAP
ncbi:MAG: rhodanese-like domain-containing protein [Polyangiales bacterium]